MTFSLIQRIPRLTTPIRPGDSGVAGMVSVVTPAWQSAGQIGGVFQSLRQQTWKSIELIIVDDGSTDDTADVVAAETARSDFPVTYIRAPHLGANPARNTGTEASRGEWIQYLDADDSLEPDKFRASLDAAAGDDAVDLVLTGVRHLVPPDTGETGESGPRQVDFRVTGTLDELRRNVLVRGQFYTPVALYRRSLIARAGGWAPRLDAAQDWDFSARQLQCARALRIVPSILCTQPRQVPGSISLIRQSKKARAQLRLRRALAGLLDVVEDRLSASGARPIRPQVALATLNAGLILRRQGQRRAAGLLAMLAARIDRRLRARCVMGLAWCLSAWTPDWLRRLAAHSAKPTSGQQASRATTEQDGS